MTGALTQDADSGVHPVQANTANPDGVHYAFGVTSRHSLVTRGYLDTPSGRSFSNVVQDVRFSNQQQIVSSDTELDLAAHEVRRGGTLVHLRPKEFQLLSVLASHPGRAYTRRQLLDRVWGPGHDGDPRTVDVHIRWLRSKIEPRPEAPVHLVTVRGVGYRLDPEGR